MHDTSQQWRLRDHLHSPSEEWRIREAALDETLAGSFPASDPPSSIPNPYHYDSTRDAGAECGEVSLRNR